MSSVAYRFYQLNKRIRIYQWCEWMYLLAGGIFIALSFGTPVGWKVLFGVILISRSSVVEHKKDILIQERESLRKEL